MVRMVNPFDLILLWPVRLLKPEGTNKTANQHAQTTLDKHCGRWVRESDLLRRGKEGEYDGHVWAEFAYFHPFFQRFLYGDGPEDNKSSAEFVLYQLSPGAAESMAVTESDWRETFKITQVRLYLMKNDTAVVVVALSAPNPITWDSALNAVSELRKTYYSHWFQDKNEGNAWKGGGARSGIHVEPRKSATESAHPAQKPAEALRNSIRNRRPQLLPRWAELLDPLVLGPAQNHAIGFEALGDNRMPAMALLGTEAPETLSPDDWFALSQADGAGFTPYAAAFRDSQMDQVCYDRWWDPMHADPAMHKQRYLASPMVFATVIKARCLTDPHWLKDFLQKWRRQYFQLFFLAHYQRAALLVLQFRIARASELLGKANRHGLLQTIHVIQEEMARFSSQCWYTEVTPQIQGQELYLKLKSQMGLEQLYKEVMDDQKHLGDWAMVDWRLQLDRVVIPIALLLALLGINVFFEPFRGFFAWLLSTAVERFRWTALANPSCKAFAVDGLVMLVFLIPAYVLYLSWRKRR